MGRVEDEWCSRLDQEMSCAPQCAICLEDTYDNDDRRPSALQCGHLFHAACIQGWLKKKPCCPTCKGGTTRSQVVNLYWHLEEQSQMEAPELVSGDDPIKVAIESLRREKDVRRRLGILEEKNSTLTEEVQLLEEQLERQIAANERIEASAAEQGRNASRMLADVDKAKNENEKLKKKVKEAEGEYNKIKNDNVAYHYIANVLEQNDHDSLEHMKRTHTVEQIINIQAKTLTWRTKQYTNLSKQVSELKYQQECTVSETKRQMDKERQEMQSKYEKKFSECSQLQEKNHKLTQEQHNTQPQSHSPSNQTMSQHDSDLNSSQRGAKKVTIAKTNHTIGGQPSMKCVKSAALMQRANNTGLLGSSGSYIRQARNACGGFVKVLQPATNSAVPQTSRGLKRGANKSSQGAPAAKLSRLDQFFRR